MTSWSIEDAISVERRHVLAAEKLVARQEVILERLTGNGRVRVAQDASDLLDILREPLELSRQHLRRLEAQLRDDPKSN